MTRILITSFCLLFLVVLPACQSSQDPAMVERIHSMTAEIAELQASGEPVSPELIARLAGLIADMNDREGGPALPIVEVGATAAMLLGIYNQMAGSQRSKRLTKRLPPG